MDAMKNYPIKETPQMDLSHSSILNCAADPTYFIDSFCWIEDKVHREWLPFKLWDSQRAALRTIANNRQVIILKARQLGLTWLIICYALWTMLFRQNSGILLFSRRETEASELLDRIRAVHHRLPSQLRAQVTVDNTAEFVLGQIGSSARCFSTTKHSGRSYSATMAVVDEADFIPDLKALLNAVKPTIDGGGRLILLSTANKSDPGSEYKRVWADAVKGFNGYSPIFLPWDAHPGRDQVWYAHQRADYELDDLYQEYPANPEQALSPRRSSKRFSPEWLTRCRGDAVPLPNKLGLPGFTAYAHPLKRHQYLISADPAEGNPSSDPSAAIILDSESWQEVGLIHGLYEPDIFAGYLAQLGDYYKGAIILVERNNHGHAVLLALEYLGYEYIYISPIDKKPGWLSNRRDKVLATSHAAQVLREGSCTINSEGVLNELATFEARTLKAPEGDHDDLAIAFINALAGFRWPTYREQKGEGISEMITYPDILDNLTF